MRIPEVNFFQSLKSFLGFVLVFNLAFTVSAQNQDYELLHFPESPQSRSGQQKENSKKVEASDNRSSTRQLGPNLNSNPKGASAQKPSETTNKVYTAQDIKEMESFDLADLIKGSAISIRWQVEGDTAGNTTDNRIIARPRLNLTIPLTRQARLRMEGQTGSSYSSGWDRILTFDGTRANFPENFAIRRLYMEYDFTENAKVQIGALPVGSPWIETRPFSFDTDGWVDGIRMAFRKVYDRVDQIHITVGKLDPNASSAFINRSFDPNKADFIQISVTGEINSRMNYLIEAAHLGVADESFARLDLDLKVQDWTKDIIDQVRTEFVADLETGKVTGASVGFAKTIGPVYVELGGIRQQRSETQRLVNNGIYREKGDAVYGTLQYRFKDSSWRLTQRCRVCVDESTCEAKYRCDTTVEKRF